MRPGGRRFPLTPGSRGVALVLIATISYGLSNNVAAPIQQRYGSIPVMARMLWVALALVTPYGVFGLTRSEFAWDSLLATIALGSLGSGLAFILVGSLLGRVGPTRSSFITYLVPVVALGLGVLFRGEVVSPIAILGSFLVIGGALLASRRDTRAPRRLPAKSELADDIA